MKLLEFDIIRWSLRITVTIVATWCGAKITGALLAFISESFGFLAFALTSTAMSYFLFRFAWFGLPSLMAVNHNAQSSRYIPQTGVSVLMVYFAVVAVMVASVSSAIYLIREIEQAYPERPILLLLVAVLFFGFILYIAHKVDVSMRRRI